MMTFGFNSLLGVLILIGDIWASTQSLNRHLEFVGIAIAISRYRGFTVAGVVEC